MNDEREPAARGAQQTMAFILRLWPERPAIKGVPAIWRLSVQDVRTGTRRGFASLEEFFAYLEVVCGEEENR